MFINLETADGLNRKLGISEVIFTLFKTKRKYFIAKL